MEGGINQELGTNTCTPIYIVQILRKGLLYSTGKSIQYSMITSMRKESKIE